MVWKDLNRNEWRMPLELFGVFCYFVMEVRERKECFSLEKPTPMSRSVSFLSQVWEQSFKRWAVTIAMFGRNSPKRVLEFDQARAASAESAARDLPRERHIFQFDEASLNSIESSSIPTTTASYVRTTTERSNGSVVVVEDHPGLNPTDERVVELQAAIHEEMQRLMIGRDPHEVLAAAECVHGESNDPEFMESQLADLVQNGTASEAFKIGVERSPGGEAVPANQGEAIPANPGEKLSQPIQEKLSQPIQEEKLSQSMGISWAALEMTFLKPPGSSCYTRGEGKKSSLCFSSNRFTGSSIHWLSRNGILPSTLHYFG
jgi:hypothetical protein